MNLAEQVSSLEAELEEFRNGNRERGLQKEIENLEIENQDLKQDLEVLDEQLDGLDEFRKDMLKIGDLIYALQGASDDLNQMLDNVSFG